MPSHPQKEKGPPRLRLVPTWAPVLTEARELKAEAETRYERERRVAKGVWQMCVVLIVIIAVGWWLS